MVTHLPRADTRVSVGKSELVQVQVALGTQRDRCRNGQRTPRDVRGSTTLLKAPACETCLGAASLRGETIMNRTG